MTKLSLAARNTIYQDLDLRALLGRSQSWDTWIFDTNPLNVKVEGTSRCLIVVNEGDPWTNPNEHNTMKFPTLVVDVWADPTRNDDQSVRFWDAQTKIEAIEPFLTKYFHLVDPGTRDGQPVIWGTAAQITAKTGLVVAGSVHRSGPVYSPIKDSEGSFMGRFIYGVNVP